MNFCNNYLNHNLIYVLNYNHNCIFYKCSNCNIFINYIINPSDEFNWESVELIYGVWQVKFYQDELLTCEEEQIKAILE